jgi:uncharacterized NAD(P)/FAD-binding protein YdhS
MSTRSLRLCSAWRLIAVVTVSDPAKRKTRRKGEALSGGKHVIVVGGGASGVLLACHLLRDHDDDIRVTLIEKRPTVGRGTAYSTAQPGHLLNVRATNMSAFADDPLHFCRWLAEHDEGTEGESPGPLTFAQRRVYGRYIAELITPNLDMPGKQGRLRLVYGEGRSIETTTRGVRIGIDDSRVFAGDIAALATGHDEAAKGGPACYVSPWESPGDAGVEEDAAVLIRGTGLTMVDYVVSLQASGHRGPIYGMSRRGLTPQAHRAVSPRKFTPQEIPFGASLVTLWHWLRRKANETMAEGGDWRSVVDGIRPYTWEIWRKLPFDSKQRFLRHARAWWEVHRHRMAPEVEQQIKAALDSGQLSLVAAKTLSVEPTETGALVTYRRRGRTAKETLQVAKIAECTGVYTNPLATTNPLLRCMLAKGLARPDPLGIGIDVDDDCAIVDKTGKASPVLFGVGPLTRAAFWEIMAVPDIRVQCAELAKHLRLLLAGRPAAVKRLTLTGGAA